MQPQSEHPGVGHQFRVDAQGVCSPVTGPTSQPGSVQRSAPTPSWTGAEESADDPEPADHDDPTGNWLA